MICLLCTKKDSYFLFNKLDVFFIISCITFVLIKLYLFHNKYFCIVIFQECIVSFRRWLLFLERRTYLAHYFYASIIIRFQTNFNLTLMKLKMTSLYILIISSRI